MDGRICLTTDEPSTTLSLKYQHVLRKAKDDLVQYNDPIFFIVQSSFFLGGKRRWASLFGEYCYANTTRGNMGFDQRICFALE
jgi:hypothetical protein